MSSLGQLPTVSVASCPMVVAGVVWGPGWFPLEWWEEPRSHQQPAAGPGCDTYLRFGEEYSCFGSWGECFT